MNFPSYGLGLFVNLHNAGILPTAIKKTKNLYLCERRKRNREKNDKLENGYVLICCWKNKVDDIQILTMDFLKLKKSSVTENFIKEKTLTRRCIYCIITFLISCFEM